MTAAYSLSRSSCAFCRSAETTLSSIVATLLLDACDLDPRGTLLHDIFHPRALSGLGKTVLASEIGLGSVLTVGLGGGWSITMSSE